jgi:CheY-like chemotaxis protein
MKKILLVEDDQNKLKQIGEFLNDSRDHLTDFALEIKKSYQSGLNAILNNQYDLILLDMSMHNFDKTAFETGGEFMQFAGEDILKEMDWNDIATSVVIVTQYDLIGDKTLTELKKLWETNYPNIYKGTVYYSANETNWKTELLTQIKNQI